MSDLVEMFGGHFMSPVVDPYSTYARLRAHETGAKPIWLKTNMDAGHGGAAGRFDRLEEVALTQVFALATVGAA